MKLKAGIGLVLVILAAAGGWFIYKYKNSSVKKTSETVKETKNDTGVKWYEYKNDKYKIALAIPEGWEAADTTEKPGMDLWAVFQPVTKTGKIEQMSLAVVSQKIPGQELSSQEEFDDWISREENFQGKNKETKLMNNEIGENNAVTIYKRGEENEYGKYWLITTWWRKEGINYYFTTMGKEQDSDFEIQLHLNILSGIKYFN